MQIFSDKTCEPCCFCFCVSFNKEYRYKIQEVHRNISKITGCFVKLHSQLPNILKTNGDHKDEKLEAIQTILDVIKMSRHATQNLVSIKKKFLLSGVSSEHKDLDKFAEATDSHLFREELEDSLKKAKGRHYSFQALKPKTNLPHASTKQEFYETSKNDRPTKIPMAGHKDIPQYNAPSIWAELKKQSSKKSQYKRHKHGRN